MRFVESRCIHCGAALRVAGDATHVCCQYCNSELRIVHDGDQVATELVRAIQEDLGQRLEVIRLQNEIERIDREWNMEREGYMVTEKGGGRSIPSVIGSIIAVIGALVFGGVWIQMTSQVGAPTLFTIFGVLIVAGIVVSAVHGILKSGAHDTAADRYQAARQRLMGELARAERAAQQTTK